MLDTKIPNFSLPATGGTPFTPPLPGQDGPGVYKFTTLAHALALSSAAKKMRRAVVVGGGLIIAAAALFSNIAL